MDPRAIEHFVQGRERDASRFFDHGRTCRSFLRREILDQNMAEIQRDIVQHDRADDLIDPKFGLETRNQNTP